MEELRETNKTVTMENVSLKAQVTNLSELLFRIASNVSSDDLKKVAVGALACASTQMLGADVSSLPLHTVLVGRQARDSECYWLMWAPLVLATAVSCLAMYRSLGQSNESSIIDFHEYRKTRRAFRYLKGSSDENTQKQ